VRVEVGNELGIALMIVGVAPLSVEKLRIKEFSGRLSAQVENKLGEIERTTRDLIFRGPLPDKYYRHISQLMFFNHFLRRDWKIRMEFSWADAAHSSLSVSCEQDYKIENLHSTQEDYVIDHFETLDWVESAHAPTRLEYVRAKYEGAGAGEWLVNEAAKPGGTVGCCENGMVRFRAGVPMRAKQALQVYERSSKAVGKQQFDYFLIGEPTDGVTCEIRYPEDLGVELDWPERQLQGQPVEPEADRCECGIRITDWDFPNPMPPCSFFTVRWQTRTTGSGGQSPTGAP
jgi:hypothetical protein